ncbi:MAG: hypothetical protein HQL79_06915 [Magnetococcales bacterium]|nr:hypothetical protein [Magnetococcales bacterium]
MAQALQSWAVLKKTVGDANAVEYPGEAIVCLHRNGALQHGNDGDAELETYCEEKRAGKKYPCGSGSRVRWRFIGGPNLGK